MRKSWIMLPMLVLLMGMGPCGPNHDDMGQPADMAVASHDIGAHAGDMAPACVMSLDGVGTGDFTIAFTITTDATVATDMAVLGQRAACEAYNMWDVRMMSTGQLEVALGDVIAYTRITTQRAINDGKPHAVVIARRSGALRVTIDGIVDTSGVGAPEDFPAGSLPPLTIGTDACEGGDGTVRLSGTITNMCLSFSGDMAPGA